MNKEDAPSTYTSSNLHTQFRLTCNIQTQPQDWFSFEKAKLECNTSYVMPHNYKQFAGTAMYYCTIKISPHDLLVNSGTMGSKFWNNGVITFVLREDKKRDKFWRRGNSKLLGRRLSPSVLSYVLVSPHA